MNAYNEFYKCIFSNLLKILEYCAQTTVQAYYRVQHKKSDPDLLSTLL